MIMIKQCIFYGTVFWCFVCSLHRMHNEEDLSIVWMLHYWNLLNGLIEIWYWITEGQFENWKPSVG